MTTKSLKLLPILLAIILSTCGLFGPDEKHFDPTNLTWTADTLRAPLDAVTLRNIWGSSANDVYAVGPSGPVDGIWHYDGKQWEPANIALTLGGTVEGNFNLNDITGFAKDDIWAVGRGSRLISDDPPTYLPGTNYGTILHFDGSRWNKVELPIGEELWSIAGYAPDDIWAGSQYGRIWHYDGVSWTIDSTSIPLPEIYDRENWGYFARIAVLGPNQVVCSYNMSGGREAYIFLFNGEEWLVDPPGYWVKNFYSSWLSPQGNLYSGGYYGVYVTTASSAPEQSLEHDEFISILGLWGTSDENIFAAGTEISYPDGERHAENVVFHYNGTRWQQLPNIIQANTWINDLWTNGREVFITGSYQGTNMPGFGSATVIMHGE